MQNTSLTVKNDGAERLWSYILAYREMMHKRHEDTKKENQQDKITFIVPPLLEQTKTNRNKKKP